MEPPPNMPDSTQGLSATVHSLQTKIVEHMSTFSGSLIDMTKASHQRAIMRRAVISGVYPTKLTARVIPAMLKPDANVLQEWDVAHNDFARRLAEILIHHYDMVIRKERDIQGLTQETIREAIESSRLPEKDLEYIQRSGQGKQKKPLKRQKLWPRNRPHKGRR